MKKPIFYKPYTGYVRELLTYASYLFQSRSDPSQKFVIFTVGRSGSSLLVSLLHSHDQITCDDELFRRRLFSPLQYLRCREMLSVKDVYGFKLNTYHFRDQKIQDPQLFLSKIHDDGYQIISLRRRNIVRQAISHMYAIHRDKFHHKETQGKLEYQKFHVDIDYLQVEIDKFEGFRALHSRLISDFPHLKIFYEDDLQDSTQHQNTIDRVVDFLDVPPAKVSTRFSKTTPRQLADFIENYESR